MVFCHSNSAQDARNRTLAVTNLLIPIIVLAGSESTITEITGYSYFSLIKPSPELTYKIELNIVPLAHMIRLIDRMSYV